MNITTDLETNGLTWWLPNFQVTHFGCLTSDGHASCERNPTIVESHQDIEEHIVFNNRFESNIYRTHFPKVKKPTIDVMLMAFCVQPWRTANAVALRPYGQSIGYQLQNLSHDILGTELYKGNEKTWEDWQRRNLLDLPYTERLYKFFLERSSARLMRTHKELLVPAHEIYGDMPHRGIHVNREWQRELLFSETKSKNELKKAMEEYHFYENPNSPERVKFHLYKVLQLPKPPPKIHKDGSQTVDTTEDTYLAEIEPLHPFVSLLRNYRTVSRNISNHLAIDSEWFKDVLYPEWHMTRLITGRPQPTKPTVVNIPKNKAYRKLVKAAPGKYLISCDMSQVEMRINAFLSRDYRMCEAYRNGEDLHTATARAMVGREPTREERDNAKPINFLYLYAGSAEKARRTALAQYGIRLSLKEATDYRNIFMSTYKGIPDYHMQRRKHILSTGLCESISGMRWDLSKLSHSRDPQRQEMAVREDLNYQCQHLGAMFMLCGLKAIEQMSWGASILTIHDQVVAQFDNDSVLDICREWNKKWLDEIANIFPEFDIPLVLDFSYGPNLGELKEVNLNG